MSSNFWKDLADADAALAEVRLPREAERRLQRRLGASMSRRNMRGPALVAFCAAVVVGALGMVLLQRVRAPEQLDGLRVAQSSADFSSSLASGEVEIRTGAVTLFDDAAGVQLRVDHPVKLKREARGIRVVRGEVEFQVSKRPVTAPTRMLVSHGEIEVHGTRFSVNQRAGTGHVTLHEGAITFHCPDGRQLALHPGESLTWPVPPPPPAEKDRAQPAPDPAPAPAPEIEEDEVGSPRAPPADPSADWRTHDRLRRAAVLLERIPKLRDSGEDAQAIKELEVAMRQDLPSAAREKLSFELGDLLTKSWETQRACRHWKDHAWRYPAGKFDEQVQTARTELDCR